MEARRYEKGILPTGHVHEEDEGACKRRSSKKGAQNVQNRKNRVNADKNEMGTEGERASVANASAGKRLQYGQKQEVCTEELPGALKAEKLQREGENVIS